MTVKLKNLDRSINKIKKKVVKMLTSGTVPNEIGKQITDNIKKTMSLGKMPSVEAGEISSGSTTLKNAPALTKKTKAVYRNRKPKVREKPRFEVTGKLKNSIQPKRASKNKIVIQANNKDGRDKLKWLKKSNKVNGQPKKSRIVLAWTKARTTIIKKIIRDAIARNFK